MHITHGITGYLATGRLPHGAGYIRKLAGQFKNCLVDAVTEAYGHVDVERGSFLQSAVDAQICVLLAKKWLRNALDAKNNAVTIRTATKTTTQAEGKAIVERREQEGLTFDQKMATLHAITKFSAARDNAVAKLRLSAAQRSTIDMLYGDPHEATEALQGPCEALGGPQEGKVDQDIDPQPSEPKP